MENEILQQLGQVVGDERIWIVQVFVIVSLTLLAEFLASTSLKRLLVRAESTHNLWDDALLGSAQAPLRLFIWLIGLSFAASIASSVAESSFQEAVEHIRRIGVIVVIAWFLIRFVSRGEANLVDPDFIEEPMDATTVRAMGKLLRVSIIITSVLVVMQTMGYSISGVLAFGGIGGIAVGFAAKDLLANFFGGLMIYLDRPFSVGDWVRSPDREIEGTVEDIGWRLTRIRTFDKRPLYIPNSLFNQIALENPSRMTNRRINETFGIRYCDSKMMSEIVEEVRYYLRVNEHIDQDQTMIVNFNHCNASSLDFFIYTFTKTTDWVQFHQIKQQVLLDIMSIIEKHGAECAFPTSTLHLETVNLQAGNINEN